MNKQEGRWSMAEQAAHSRMISNNFKKSLQSGILSPAVDLVRKDPDLFLGLRGNYVIIYYKSHVLFKIRPKGKTSFDANHAKYTADWADKKQKLLDLGMEEKGKYLEYAVKPYDSTFWCEAGAILKSVMKDYFTQAKSQDDKEGKELEKQRQHTLILKNRQAENGFMVYDLEFREPDSANAKGRFDLLALKVKDHVVVSLWILEVKSTYEACYGDKGVAAHKEDMRNYVRLPQFSALRRQRRVDAKKIIEAYRDLDLPGWSDIPAFADDYLDTLPLEYGFILTDTATQFKEKEQYRVCETDEGHDFRIETPKKAQP
jgi:hypothetical protein